MSIEEKLKTAEPTTWLTDGLSESELKFLKIRVNLYLVWVRICLKTKAFVAKLNDMRCEMKCKDCFMYSICNGTCDWDNKPVDANDSADDCPNFDYYPNDD